MLCTDVGHHCNKIDSFCSQIFIKSIFKCYVYGGKKEKVSSGIISKNEGLCNVSCSLFCDVKFKQVLPEDVYM